MISITSDGFSLARTESQGHINTAARETGKLPCARPQFGRSGKEKRENGGGGQADFWGRGRSDCFRCRILLLLLLLSQLPRAECCGSDRCVTRRECPSLHPPGVSCEADVWRLPVEWSVAVRACIFMGMGACLVCICTCLYRCVPVHRCLSVGVGVPAQASSFPGPVAMFPAASQGD